MPDRSAALDALEEASDAADAEVERLRDLLPALRGEIHETPHHRVEIEKDIASVNAQIVEASRASDAAHTALYAAMDDPSYWTEGPDPPQWFNPDDLHESLKYRPARSVAAFAASCAERLIPAYRSYCEETGRDGQSALESLLGLAWDRIREGHLTRTEFASYLDTCTALAPSPDGESATFATDAARACEHVLRALFSGDQQEGVNAARCAYESVLRHVTVRLGVFDGTAAREPLVQVEVTRQHRDLYDLLLVSIYDQEADDAFVHQLRERARSEAPTVFGESIKC